MAPRCRCLWNAKDRHSHRKKVIQVRSPHFLLALAISILLTSCGGGEDGDSLDPNVRVVSFNEASQGPLKSIKSWYVINENPPFGPRDHASIINVNNKIHLRGGGIEVQVFIKIIGRVMIMV